MNKLTYCKGCNKEIIFCKSKGCWFAHCKGFIHQDGGFHCCPGKNTPAEPRDAI